MSPTSLRWAWRYLAIRALLRLYPAAWRRRYGAEFAALLAQRSLSPLEVVDIVRGAIDARLQASRGVRVATSSATQASCVAPQCCQKGREHDMARRDNRYRCSFCGKSRDQVRRLIAGPGVYICDECVALCNEIIADEETPLSCQRPEEARSAVRRRAAPRWQRLVRRWLEIGRGERLRMTAPQPIAGTASSGA